MSNLSNIWMFIGVCFATYFFVSLVYKKLGVNNLQTALMSANGLRLLNLKHLLGIVLFGILSYIQTPELNYLVKSLEIAKLHTLIPFFIIVFLSVFASQSSFKRQQGLRETEINHYNFSNAWVYFSIRFAFLFCYEYFFRGVMLFMFLDIFSLPVAIFYSTVLYVLIHIFDSKKEIIGAIPFGIILCLFTYLTGSVWYAFLIHLSLSATYEISMFYYVTFKYKTIKNEKV